MWYVSYKALIHNSMTINIYCSRQIVHHWPPSLHPSQRPHITRGSMALMRPAIASSTQSRAYSGGVKLQFPPLPKEWEGYYKAGQMFAQQDSLPHLPVPPLQQTLERYLKFVQVGWVIRVPQVCTGRWVIRVPQVCTGRWVIRVPQVCTGRWWLGYLKCVQAGGWLGYPSSVYRQVSD